jgi:DNA invertase Pin-like site-specific DNA recombinase
MAEKYVAYFRVSTKRQGASGLGLEAQEAAVDGYVAGRGEVIGRFTEIESGRRNDRPQLNEAIATAKRNDAVLVIAKLDRLSRNVLFTAQLMASSVKFVCCDMPEADDTTIYIFAAIAQREARRTAERTAEALQAAKARGVKLGTHHPSTAAGAALGRLKAELTNRARAADHAERVAVVVDEIRAAGVTTLVGVAKALNARGEKTARGGKWRHETVSRILKRTGRAA